MDIIRYYRNSDIILDKHTIFTHHVNKFLMLYANYILFKNVFECFEIHKLIFIYACTIPFDVIVNECPYLRVIMLNLCYDDFKDDKHSPDPKKQKGYLKAIIFI